MNIPRSWIVIAGLVLGAGGLLGYDAYRDHERRKALEAQSTGASCSLCNASKADLERLRREIEQKAPVEAQKDADVE